MSFVKLALDTPTEPEVICGDVRFSGWCIHAQLSIHDLVLIANGRRISCQYGIRRPDIVLAFPEWSRSNKVGFEVVANLDPGHYNIHFEARLEDGALIFPEQQSTLKVRPFPIWKRLAFKPSRLTSGNSSGLVDRLRFVKYLIGKAVDWVRQNGISRTYREFPRLARKAMAADIPRQKFRGLEPDEIRKRLDEASSMLPMISVVMPVYNTPIELLLRSVGSVRKQIYSNWELCICDDGSRNEELRQRLLDFSSSDHRIKVLSLDNNIGISLATNKAISLATGEFVALLDHDDELTVDALAEVALFISENRDIDVIYTDQDKINERGRIIDTFFKPDWSPDYFRRVMYVGHLLVIRSGLFAEAGGFDTRFDRVQDYEFMLRISERTQRIAHIPQILYHWRASEGSIASSSVAKGEIGPLQCEAVRLHLARIGLPREVLPHPDIAHRTIIRPINGAERPKVSIIIPSKDHPEHIGRCLRSIFDRSTYDNFEVVVVDNGTTDREALRILGAHPITVLPYNEHFNYSRANNLGVSCASGEVVVLLNNDTEIITPEWIELLLANLDQKDVGAVGALLLYPNMTVQHAGIVLGPRGTADHVMRGFPWQADGYAGSLSCVREVSAVTGACLMTRKDVYTALGGLVEHYGTHYQDVDYCLHLRGLGKRILLVPEVQITHYESATRKSDYDLLDRLLLQDTWSEKIRQGDPYYNPAFSLTKLDYSRVA